MDRNIFTDKVKGALIKFPPHAYYFYFTYIVYSNPITDNVAGMKQNYENLFLHFIAVVKYREGAAQSHVL